MHMDKKHTEMFVIRTKRREQNNVKGMHSHSQEGITFTVLACSVVCTCTCSAIHAVGM